MEEKELTQTSESDSKSEGRAHRDHQSISRKISVAPMMDWTDIGVTTIWISNLRAQ
jgi:hypothetical protein